MINLWQNIVDNFTKIKKIAFSLQYSASGFRNFLEQMLKFALLETGLVLVIKFKHFRNFLQIPYFPKVLRLSKQVSQLLYSLSCNNNLLFVKRNCAET